MSDFTHNPPIKDRCRQWVGQIKIAPGHLGVVFRDGKFARFLQSGWNDPISSWDEQLVAVIPIQFYQVETNLDVKSADGFSFKAVMSIQFMFNPDKVTGPNRAERIMLALSDDIDDIIQNQVARQAKYCLAKSAGDYLAADLVGGQARARLARSVRHHLHTTLSDQGVIFHASGSVLIESLTPPEALTESQIKFYERQKTVDLLNQHPDLALKAFLLETSLQPNNMMFGNRTLLQNLVETLYMDAFAKSSEPDVFPNSHRQTAAVYANTPINNNGFHVETRR